MEIGISWKAMEYAFTMQLINQLEGSRLMHLRTVSFWEKAARNKAQAARNKAQAARHKAQGTRKV
jgi:hypothetical protein